MQSTSFLRKHRLDSLFIFIIFLNFFPAKSQDVNYDLTNGDRVSGELIEEESSINTKVIISPLFGKIKIDSSSIARNDSSPQPSRWGTEFSVGLNSSTTDANIGSNYLIDLSTIYTGENNTLRLDIDYKYDQVIEDSQTSVGASNGGFDIRNDFKDFGKYNLYADIEYDYDGLNTSGKNRTIASFGISKTFFESQNKSLILSLGPAFLSSFGGEECSSDNYCGQSYYSSKFQATYNWSINKLLELILDHKFTAINASKLLRGMESTASMKFIPSVNSSYYSKFEYKNSYQELTLPSTQNTYTMSVGKSF